jgi:hypothetical protein
MDERRGACRVLMGNLKRRSHFQVLVVDGMIILTIILKICENVIGEWTWLSWLRTVKGDGLL